MTPRTMEWLLTHTSKDMFFYKDVLEVGSLNVNGSLRPEYEPVTKSWYGLDLTLGEGVDFVANVFDINAKQHASDIVVCTEVLEHLQDWRNGLIRLAELTKSILILTTRGRGFPKHDYPSDYWRFTLGALVDMLASVGEWDIIGREDWRDMGVYFIANRVEF